MLLARVLFRNLSKKFRPPQGPSVHEVALANSNVIRVLTKLFILSPKNSFFAEARSCGLRKFGHVAAAAVSAPVWRQSSNVS